MSWINAQSGTYTLQATDNNKSVVFNSSSPCVATLPYASWLLGGTFRCQISNTGTGAVSVTPSGCNLDGVPTVVTLSQYQSLEISSDGTDYFSGRGVGGSGGSGTVTSVQVTVPSRQTASGGPITGSGVIAIADNTQAANTVFKGPSSGAAAVPTFSALVPADLPVGSSSALGAVKVDGTTITASAGVISAVTGTTFGTFASLPVSPTTGQLYYFTDSIYEYAIYDGTKWNYFGGGRVLTPPVDASFAWQNQSTSTKTTTSGGVHVLSAVGTNANNCSGRYITYPTGSFTIIMAYRMRTFPFDNGPSSSGCGMYVSDGTAVRLFGLNSAAYLYQGGPSMTNITTNIMTIASAAGQHAGPGDLYWIKMDDGVTAAGQRTWYISYDGTTYFQAFQESNTAGFTATRVGFHVGPYATGMQFDQWVAHWVKTP